MHMANITPADVRRWFYSMSATPANANRTLPVLSVMMTQVGLRVGRLLGHRRRRTTAIYAHLDDNALQHAAVLPATLIAHAM